MGQVGNGEKPQVGEALPGKDRISRNRFEAAGAPRDLVDRWFKEARAAWYG
ncbi:MAG: hypothetical protein ACXVB9_01165 [Bdellovibrionota bacterium]